MTELEYQTNGMSQNMTCFLSQPQRIWDYQALHQLSVLW